VPPQVWHSPLPPHIEQEDSSPNAARISSPVGFPLPWQPAQFPSPGESQLWQLRVVIPHLPLFVGDSDPGSRLCQTDLVRGSGSFWSLIKQTAARPRSGRPLQMRRPPPRSFLVAAAPSRVLRDGAGIFLFKLDHYLVQTSLSPKKIRRPSHPILRRPRTTGCSTNQKLRRGKRT
jgi:hypothetical protein